VRTGRLRNEPVREEGNKHDKRALRTGKNEAIKRGGQSRVNPLLGKRENRRRSSSKGKARGRGRNPIRRKRSNYLLEPSQERRKKRRQSSSGLPLRREGVVELDQINRK
jgi:hypothetical protein